MSFPTLCAPMDALSPATQAQLNVTSPWTFISPGWAPEPNAGRGTTGVIWSCLVTIFACSWTVTHPNFGGRGLGSKVYCCFMAVFIPEMMAFIALEDFLRVRHHLKIIRKRNEGQWTMSILFFIRMGGVKLEFEDCAETLGCTTN
jgi:hypothetical protein